MISFKEFCNINEGVDSLAGLPKKFIKQITSRRNRCKNSEIELYKKNAKQKDLITVIKFISEANSNSNNYKYRGIIIKTNDVYNFYVKYIDYDTFKLFSPEYYEVLENDYMNNIVPVTTKFTASELSAADLSIFIDFSVYDTVDIYLVTVDTKGFSKL